jgi:PAS domain S-box-containing protein
METTFMTIHSKDYPAIAIYLLTKVFLDLSPEANILYASESIVDILGFQPEDVVGKSCFDYFHPDEVPGARVVHSRGVQMDKAAVLHYARIINHQGQWVGCECVFTIVHSVLVACTSIYKGDAKNESEPLERCFKRLIADYDQDVRSRLLPSDVYLHHLHEILATTCWSTSHPSFVLLHRHPSSNLELP